MNDVRTQAVTDKQQGKKTMFINQFLHVFCHFQFTSFLSIRMDAMFVL